MQSRSREFSTILRIFPEIIYYSSIRMYALFFYTCCQSLEKKVLDRARIVSAYFQLSDVLRLHIQIVEFLLREA